MNRYDVEKLLLQSLQENWPGAGPDRDHLRRAVAAAVCDLDSVLGEHINQAPISQQVVDLVKLLREESQAKFEALRQVDELKRFDVRLVTYPYNAHQLASSVAEMQAHVNERQAYIDKNCDATQPYNKAWWQNKAKELEAEIDQARAALGGFGGAPFDGSLKGGIDAISMRCAAVERRILGLEVELKDERETRNACARAAAAANTEVDTLRKVAEEKGRRINELEQELSTLQNATTAPAGSFDEHMRLVTVHMLKQAIADAIQQYDRTVRKL